MQSLKLLHPIVLEELHLQENNYLTFDFGTGVKITRNIAQYALHHVTYADAKFEVATANSLGRDAITSKYIICLLTVTLGSRSNEI